MTLLTKSPPFAPQQPPASEPDWSLGWREEQVRTPDGKTTFIRIPLTPEEILHPEEGYVMPIRTQHDRIVDDLCDMLRAHYEGQPEIAVFHDLSFAWDHPEIKPYAPDIAVTPHVRNRAADRGQFMVADEGTRPLLVIEVVSPHTRANDRVTKVRDYARLGVREYVYIDHGTRKGQEFWEIAGFRLDEGGYYLPLLPDEDGAIYCATVGLRIGLENGQVWLEDETTGENLLTNLEVRRALHAAEAARQVAEADKQAAEAARQAAEVRATTEADARQVAEKRAAELEAQLRALQEQIAQSKTP